MKYATLNGERLEPAPKLKAKCPFCESDVVARCGKVRVWHWAHKSTTHCDHWWESEKQWHRDWKNLFPNEWQEQRRRDDSGEWHIADVLTPTGLALEFQHSAIARDEVEKRTGFHNDICWIVDGMRLESTVKQFKSALSHARPLSSRGAVVCEVYYYDSRFLKRWSGLNAPVVIDFGFEDVWVIGKSLANSALMYLVGKTALVEQLKLGNRPRPVQITQSVHGGRRSRRRFLPTIVISVQRITRTCLQSENSFFNVGFFHIVARRYEKKPGGSLHRASQFHTGRLTRAARPWLARRSRRKRRARARPDRPEPCGPLRYQPGSAR